MSTDQAINDVVLEKLHRNGGVAIGADEQRKEGWPPDAVLKKAKTFQPEFIFMFRVWPGLTGVDIAPLLFESFPEAKFIVRTLQGDEDLNGGHCAGHHK